MTDSYFYLRQGGYVFIDVS